MDWPRTGAAYLTLLIFPCYERQNGTRRYVVADLYGRSRNVGAYFGPTTKRWQSGTSIDIQGRISEAGDPDVRHAPCEAASSMLTRLRPQDLRRGDRAPLPQEGGRSRGPKLAVITHTMWRDGTFYADAPAPDPTPTLRPA